MSLSPSCYDQEFPSTWTISEDEEDLSLPEVTTPVRDVASAATIPRLLTPIPTSDEDAPVGKYLAHLPSSWLLPVEKTPTIANSPYIGRSLTRGQEEWNNSNNLHLLQRRETLNTSVPQIAIWNQGHMKDRAKSASPLRALANEDRLEELRKELSQRLAKVICLEESTAKKTESTLSAERGVGRSALPKGEDNEISGTLKPPGAGEGEERKEGLGTEEDMWGETLSLYSATWGEAPYYAPPMATKYSSRASASTVS